MSPISVAEPISDKGLLKIIKEKGGDFTRENQTVDEYDQSNPVKT
jgi:hypothetical protein